MPKPYIVYILECADGTYYTGTTSDLSRRLSTHEAGADPLAYTYPRRPVKLKWAQEFHSKDDALRLERQIKGWSKAKKEALINNDYQKIHDIVKEERRKRASTMLSAKTRKKRTSH
ncbi:MAG: GIY-YIG nuclease family protein [Anaerolineales bacterium]|nr:GIY-YIG nuclease family protein [Anaerolineales bacterium]